MAVLPMLAAPACIDGTPRGSGSSISATSAEHTAFRGPMRAKLTLRPPQPTVGMPVEVVLAGGDDKGGALTLSVSYDGERPDDEGTTRPTACPPRSDATRTERHAFDRPGPSHLRLLVVSERCNGRRAVIEVRATVVVAP